MCDNPVYRAAGKSESVECLLYHAFPSVKIVLVLVPPAICLVASMNEDRNLAFWWIAFNPGKRKDLIPYDLVFVSAPQPFQPHPHVFVVNAIGFQMLDRVQQSCRRLKLLVYDRNDKPSSEIVEIDHLVFQGPHIKERDAHGCK